MFMSLRVEHSCASIMREINNCFNLYSGEMVVSIEFGRESSGQVPRMISIQKSLSFVRPT